MNKFWGAVLIIVLVSSFSGCVLSPSYLRVDVSIETTFDSSEEPEILVSESFRKRKEKMKYFIISLPSDYYVRKSISETKGILNSEVLLKEQYVPWITEIEKILIENGYRVLSRNQFNELLLNEEISSLIQAASLLGADAIIQINSLEYNNTVPIDHLVSKKIKFHKSNRFGEYLGPISINQEDKNQIVPMVMKQLEGRPTPTAQMTLLDCKIIDAKTSEIVWFYRNTKYFMGSNLQKQEQYSYFFELTRSDFTWIISQPEDKYRFGSFKRKTRGVNSYDEVTISEAKSGSRESREVLEFILVKEICRDFVERLKGK